MEKSEILKAFLGSKLQISREGLGYLEKEEIKEDALKSLIYSLKSSNKKTAKTEDIKELLNAKTAKESFFLLKKCEPLPNVISIDDLIQDKIKTYEMIRNLLQYRWELVNTTSISKISSNAKKFSLIAEVISVDKRNKKIELQDNTGVAEASMEKLGEAQISQIEEGDILGFVCESANPIIIANAVNPDIPLFKSKKSATGKTALVFSCKLSEKEGSLQKATEKLAQTYDKIYVFDFEDKETKNLTETSNQNVFIISGSRESGKNTFSNVAMIEIGSFNLLVCHENVLRPTQAPINFMINLLKKRIINCHNIGGKSVLPFVIDPVPDIFVANLGGDAQSNYKNTILLSLGENQDGNILWLVDLQTYECLKIGLS